MNLRQIYNKHMGSDYKAVETLGISPAEEIFSDSCYGNLLDVGAGNGHFGLTLLANGQVNSVTFLDVADICIEYILVGIHEFKLYNRDWALHRGLVEDFKLTEQVGFDTIAFFEGLEHVIDVKIAVDRIYSLLKEGGIFIGSVPVGMACNNPLHLHYFYEGDIQEVLSNKFSQIVVKEIVVGNESHYVFKAGK